MTTNGVSTFTADNILLVSGGDASPLSPLWTRPANTALSISSGTRCIDPQPPPIAEFAAGNLSAENPPEKLRRAELAAEFC